MIDNPLATFEVEDLPELLGDADFAVRDASQLAIAEGKAAGISIFYQDPYSVDQQKCRF